MYLVIIIIIIIVYYSHNDVPALLLPGDALPPPALAVPAGVPCPVHHGGVLLGIQGAARAYFVAVLGRLEEVDEFVVYINFLQTA